MLPSRRMLSLALTLALAPLAAADTLYVDANLGSGAGDGTTWADAYQGSNGLQLALAAAVSGDEIWVADGTYKATTGASRDASFGLKNGVTIYGSFAGGESDPADRPAFGSSDSILSGDLADNDGSSIFNDNSYHLITTGGTNATAVIDGFVVTGGAATGSGSNRDKGGGILCTGNVSPTVRHCRFIANRCTFGGAAGYINNGGAPSFTDCTFEDGIGGAFGGAFDIAGGGAVRYERCLFRGNTAARAGALEIFSTNGVIVANCIFRDNVATGAGGGAIWVGSGGNTQFRFCTVVGNSATANAAGGLLNQGAGGTSVHNSIFWDNEGPGGAQNSANQISAGTTVHYSNIEGGYATGQGNISVAPAFVDAGAGDFRLTADSGGIDGGNNSATPAGVLTDYAGNVRRLDDPFTADSGLGAAPFVDMGAYEFVRGPWEDLGAALAGTNGLPSLVPLGSLELGDDVSLALTGALASTTSYFVIGITPVNLPFYGGTLVPSFEAPFGLFIGLPTNASGELLLGSPWPGGVPGGTELYFQHWLVDAGGPFGFASSNAVKGTVP